MRYGRAFGFLVGLAGIAVWSAQPLAAQEIVLDTGSRARAVRVLERILNRGNYLLIARDTVLPREFHTGGDVVVWDARVRLEGRVAGAVAVVQGTLVVRPGARLGGPTAALDGLVLSSGLAEVGPVVELPAGHRVRSRHDAGRLYVEVRGPPPVPRLGLAGFWGLRLPQYDRVDGLSVSWGPRWRIARREFGPLADAWITLRSARGRPGGGARLWLPIGAEVEAVATVERATRTADGWIRNDVSNSVEALLLGRDLRDYHESEQLGIRVGRRPLGYLAPGALELVPYVVVRRARDRSLTAQRPWSAAARDRLGRANPPVTEVPYTSGEFGTGVAWQGGAARFRGTAAFEHGRGDREGLRFSQGRFEGRLDVAALRGHLLSVGARSTLAWGGQPAPAQRWSFVGGQGTLPTLPVAALRGDNVVLVQSEYRVPVGLDLPLAGSPALELIHATGTAWVSGRSMPAWEQNLGIGVAVGVVRVRAWIDPAIDRPRPTLLLELSAPPTSPF